MPRSRTALPRTDPLDAKGKNARGQEPRIQAQVFSKNKGLQKFFSRTLQNFNNSKNTAVFEQMIGQF